MKTAYYNQNMQLVEKHQIGRGHKAWTEIDALCFRSKNLYNTALYHVRQHYFTTEHYLSYPKLDRLLQDAHQHDYYSLNTQISQNVLRWLDKNYVSYFEALKVWAVSPELFEHKPGPPRYKHKTKGRNLVVYSRQRLHTRPLRNGIITPHGTSLRITTKVDPATINQVRIIPKCGHYVVEIVYTVPDVAPLADNGRYAAIDLGVNNLAAVVSSVHDPVLIKGTPLKSINHYYNRRKSELQSALPPDQKTSHRLQRLERRRTNKISDHLHKATHALTNHLASLGVTTVIIGKNPNWKQEVNMGKKNNQSFVQIPFCRFIDQLTYKCALRGITVITQEESYTSRCSYLDDEPLEHHEHYLGRRVKRGLFRSASGITLNADVNGAANILRKHAISNGLKPKGIQGVVVSPLSLKSAARASKPMSQAA